MKTNAILLGILMSALLAGCNSSNPIEEPPIERYSTSYVTDYFDIDYLIYKGYGRMDGGMGYTIMVSASGDYTAEYSYDDVGESKEIFDALCEKNNDLTYKGSYPVKMHIKYPVFDFIGVSIISDANFDAGHPAGTPLNDITMCEINSPYPYILSGYTELYEWKSGYTETVWRPFHIINKPLLEFGAQDFKLPGFGGGSMYSSGEGGGVWYNVLMWFYFMTQPTLAKTHNFTITLTTDDGREFSGTAQIKWGGTWE